MVSRPEPAVLAAVSQPSIRVPAPGSCGPKEEPAQGRRGVEDVPHESSSASRAWNVSSSMTPWSRRICSVSNRSGLGAADSWGKPETLPDHFRNHGADFGVATAEEYARIASDFFVESQARGFPTKIDSNGIIRVWDPATNRFGAYNPDGSTRTFYKPQPRSPSNPRGHRYPTNEDYWNAQPGNPPWMPPGM